MTEPEQWAVELAAKVIPAWWRDDGDYAEQYESHEAAMIIQRAFEKRERKLREEWEAERISLLQANYTLNSQLADYALKIRQALKDTTHD